MCQGVIAVYDPRTQAYHWGIGSHNELLKRLWPSAPNNAEDKIIKFEAVLRRGPGELTVESPMTNDDCDIIGPEATPELRDIFRTKLLEKAGTVKLIIDFIQDRVKEGFEMDTAFARNILTDRAFNEYQAATVDEEDAQEEWETKYENSLTRKQRQARNLARDLKDLDNKNYRGKVLEVMQVAVAKVLWNKNFTAKQAIKYVNNHNEKQQRKVRAMLAKLVSKQIMQTGNSYVSEDLEKKAQQQYGIISIYNFNDGDEIFGLLTKGQRKQALALIDKERKRLLATVPKMPTMPKPPKNPLKPHEVFIALASNKRNINQVWKKHYGNEKKTATRTARKPARRIRHSKRRKTS